MVIWSGSPRFDTRYIRTVGQRLKSKQIVHTNLFEYSRHVSPGIFFKLISVTQPCAIYALHTSLFSSFGFDIANIGIGIAAMVACWYHLKSNDGTEKEWNTFQFLHCYWQYAKTQTLLLAICQNTKKLGDATAISKSETINDSLIH